MQRVTSFPLGWSVQQRVAVEKASKNAQLLELELEEG